MKIDNRGFIVSNISKFYFATGQNNKVRSGKKVVWGVKTPEVLVEIIKRRQHDSSL